MSKIVFDENSLTLGDLEDFEDVTGKPLQEAMKTEVERDAEGNIMRDDKGRPVENVSLSAKALTAIVWITKRQENSAFTLADARCLKVSELDIVMGDDEDSDPKETDAA